MARPQDTDVRRHFHAVVDHAKQDWEELAYRLNMPRSDIRATDMKRRGDPTQCCRDMLELWVGMNGRRATLDVLKDALVGCKHQDVVDLIEGRPTSTITGDWWRQEEQNRDMRRIFLLIKEKLGVRWKDLARGLHFEEPTIEVFTHKHRDPRDACTEMLEEWRQREGRRATVEVLLEGLEAVGRMDIVDAIREHEEEFRRPQQSTQVLRNREREREREEEFRRPQCSAHLPRNRDQKRVFISYTVDPYTDPTRTARQRDSHIALQRDRVRALSDELRRNGVDSVIDQYLEQTPPNLWTRWTEDEMEKADYVLMICTPNYLQCVTGQQDEETSSEYKVRFEGKVIYSQLADPTRHDKFLPVFFDRIDRNDVPTVFQGAHFYGPMERTPRYGQGTFNQLFCKIVGSVPRETLPPPIGNIPPGLVPVPRRV